MKRWIMITCFAIAIMGISFAQAGAGKILLNERVSNTRYIENRLAINKINSCTHFIRSIQQILLCANIEVVM